MLNRLVLPAALLTLGLTEARSYAAPFPRYDQIQMYSPHNSFQKWQDPNDILAFYNIRSMEWDVHAAPLLPDVPSDWQIWHTDDIVGKDLNTHCLNLEDCVRQVKGFHDLVRMHEVITIYMDEGDNPTFAGFADTTAMDQLLENVLGRGAIFTPSDLLATCPGTTHLGDAVRTCGWPTTDTLRGKFIFISNANSYGYSSGGGGVSPEQAQYSHDLFHSIECPQDNSVCPGSDGAWDFGSDDNLVVASLPEGNFPYGPVTLDGALQNARDNHVVTRLWKMDYLDIFDDRKSRGANILAGDGLDNYDYPDVGPNTVSASGWPFVCVPQDTGSPVNCSDIHAEPTNHTVTLESETGGGGGLFITRTGTSDVIQSLVGLPYNHDMDGINLAGYGCVMVRSSTSSSAHYFAACRGNDTGPAFMRFNEGSGPVVVSSPLPQPPYVGGGNPTGFYDLSGGTQHNQYEWGRVKIELEPNDASTCNGGGVDALAWSCRSGEDCAFIGSHAFCNDTLPVRGTYVQNTVARFVNATVSEDRVTPADTWVNFSDLTLSTNQWGSASTVWSSSATVSAGSWFYPNVDFSVPTDATIHVDMEGGSPDADLYTRAGTLSPWAGVNPTLGAFDCASRSNTSFERCSSSPDNPVDTPWRIGVFGYANSPTVSLKVSVTGYSLFHMGLVIPANGDMMFPVFPYVGQKLRVATTSTSDVGLYLKDSAYPTTSSYDQASHWTGAGAQQTLLHKVGTGVTLVGVTVHNYSGSVATVTLDVDGD